MCARSRESTCPDVSQLCSTTKQYLIQSNGKKKKKKLAAPPLPPSLPFSLPPIIPCALLSPPPKKLLITRQRSVIKTHVYTRVSFMDQDLEKEDGGSVGGGSRHVSAVSTMSSNEQPSSVSSLLSWTWTLCRRGQKTSNNAAIQHVVSLLPQQTQRDVKTFEK